LTDTSQEISIVLDEESIKEFPEGVLKLSKDYYRALELWSSVPQVGLVHSLSHPLANAGISIFYISTYETDFTLIKEEELDQALTCLKNNLPNLSINNHRITTTTKSTQKPLKLADFSSPIDAQFSKKLKLAVSANELVLASVQKKILPFIGMSILKLLFFSYSPERFFSYCQTNSNISMILPAKEYESLSETAESIGFSLSSFSDSWNRIVVDEGPLGFDEPGIVDAISSPLSKIDINIYYISTFDTDHLLVKQKDTDRAVQTLTHHFIINHKSN